MEMGDGVMEVDGQVDREAVLIMNSMAQDSAIYQLLSGDGAVHLTTQDGTTLDPGQLQVTGHGDGQAFITMNVVQAGENELTTLQGADGVECYLQIPVHDGALSGEDPASAQGVSLADTFTAENAIQVMSATDDSNNIVRMIQQTAADADDIGQLRSEDIQGHNVNQMTETNVPGDQQLEVMQGHEAIIQGHNVIQMTETDNSGHQRAEVIQGHNVIQMAERDDSGHQRAEVIQGHKVIQMAEILQDDGTEVMQTDETGGNDQTLAPDNVGGIQETGVQSLTGTAVPSRSKDGVESFATSSLYETHQREAHQTLTCKECNAVFSDQGLLDRHAKLHSKVSMFMCDVCGSIFTKEKYLTFHMAVHEGEDDDATDNVKESIGNKSDIIGEVDETKERNAHDHEDKRKDAMSVVESITEAGSRDGDETNQIDAHDKKTVEVNVADTADDIVAIGEVGVENGGTETYQMIATENWNEEDDMDSDSDDDFDSNASLSDSEDDDRLPLMRRRKKKLQCPHCERSYIHLGMLKRHVATHGMDDLVSSPDQDDADVFVGEAEPEVEDVDDDKEQCEICHKRYRSKRMLERHIKTHANDDPKKCPICGKSFKTAVSCRKHKLTHNVKKPRSFKGQKLVGPSIANGRKSQEGRVSHDCNVCGKVFRTEFTLLAHRILHEDAKPFRCQTCNKDFESKANLKSHMKLGTCRPRHKCNICEKQFTLLAQMKKHVKEDHPDASKQSTTPKKLHKCVTCGEYFETLRLLRAHKKTHRKLKVKPKCEVCGKAFKSHFNLSNHRRVHTDERPFCCEECGKSFKEKGSLMRHKEIHTGLKPHKCDECGVGFTDASALRGHKLLHKGEKEHECEVCHMKFHKMYRLRLHRLTHGGQDHKEPNLIHCKECGQGFLNDSSLRRHRTSKRCGKKYPCPLCEKHFQIQAEARTHLEEAHLAEIHGFCKKDEESDGGHQDQPVGKYLKCSKCDRTFKDLHYFTLHFLAHKEDEELTCEVCNEKFPSRTTLKSHMGIHDDTKPKCKTCGKTFFDVKSLQRHMLLHTGEKPYACDVCGKKFSDRSACISHATIHSSDRPFKCSVCSRTFRLKGACTQHKKVVHGIDASGNQLDKAVFKRPKYVFRCRVCKEQFTKAEDLLQHKKGHPELADDPDSTSVESEFIKPYTCDVCGSNFAHKSYLQRHQRVHTGEKPYKCDVCDRDFGDRSSLTKHKSIHSGAKPYLCDLCGKSFRDKSYLKLHNRMHVGDRPHECTVCGMRFVRKNFLNAHMKIHDGTKKKAIPRSSTCEVCGKVLQSRSSFQTHMMAHNGIKPYQCSLCDKAFVTKIRLENHFRVHTGEKPFQCDQCEKAFAEPGALRRHKIIHSGLKPYKCNICQKAFSDRSALTMHAKIHTGIKDHHCDVCGHSFYTKTNLRSHMKTHIKNVPLSCGVCGMQILTRELMAEHLAEHEVQQQAAAQALAKTMLAVHQLIDDGSIPAGGLEEEVQATLLPPEQPPPEFKCDICLKNFKTKSNLQKHALVHSAEKNFECNVCHKRFARKVYLVNHATIHTGEKPYSCAECGKEFRDRSSMRRHKNIHTAYRLFECNVCKKQFKDKSAANIHLRIHTEEKPYECNQCKQVFTQSGHLVAHMMKMH